MRPNIRGEYRIKFKAEALPLKDKLGGYRMLFSHNVEFGLDQARGVDSASLATLVNLFPLLATLKKSGAQKIELVKTIESSRKYCRSRWASWISAKASPPGATPPCGGNARSQAAGGRISTSASSNAEASSRKSDERCKRFFVSLQQIGREWVSLGTTKTGIVYRLKGNPPQAHE